jgi:hypothetical protein
MTADRELAKFIDAPVQEGRRVVRVHPVRLVLTAALLLAVGGVLAPTFDELLFHFRRDPATDIGDPLALTSGSVLPVGARVRAHVVLGNRAAEIPLWREGSLRFGPIVVRQVLGAPLFVEGSKAAHPTWGPFVEADVDGRVVAFDGELAEVRRLIESQGAEVPADARVLIVDERPGDMNVYLYTWTLGLSLAIWAILSLVRAARPRVVAADVGADVGADVEADDIRPA